MPNLSEEDEIKYFLAGILPNCGECCNFSRINTYRDNVDSICNISKKRLRYINKACDLFKPLLNF